MGEFLAYNANRIIWYDEKNQLVDEWKGGIFQISDIKIQNAEMYMCSKLNSKFVPQIEKIDVSISIPKENYSVNWEKTSEDEISIKLKFAVDKLKGKRFGIESLLYGNRIKAEINFKNEKQRERFENKRFIYVGRNWMLAQRKNKLIEMVPNNSKVGKMKAIVANMQLL